MMSGNSLFEKNVAIRVLLSVLMLSLAGCSITGGNRSKLSDDFFISNPNIKKEYIVGAVEYIGDSSYEPQKCPDESVCIHKPTWKLYEINGYILPGGEELTNIVVAHEFGSALITTVPWLATIQKVEDKNLSEKIGADYILVGVELGGNIFCPSNETSKLFNQWKSDIRNKTTNESCYLL